LARGYSSTLPEKQLAKKILTNISMTIYVGNLNYRVSEEDLVGLFTGFGEVKSVKIVKDMNTGRAKGFAFVEMEEEASAQEAISSLNEKEFMSRALVVNEARPRTNFEPRAPRSNDGGFQRRSNGGGYNGRSY
jgi:RNA recognition motif-containing protein